MERDYCNFPSQHYKMSARNATGLRHNDNSSQSRTVRSTSEKPQGAGSAAQNCAMRKRQLFFSNPNPWKGKTSSTKSPNKDYRGPHHSELNVNPQLTLLNANQRYRAATINNNANNNFEQISDEDSVYENLDAYWHPACYQNCNNKTITYTTPSELFVSTDKRKTLNKAQMQMSDSSTPQPPPLPAKFRRTFFLSHSFCSTCLIPKWMSWIYCQVGCRHEMPGIPWKRISVLRLVRERFAARMSGSISDVDSSSACSQQQISTSHDSKIFKSEESISSTDSDSRTYVNLEVRSNTTPTKILQSVNEKLMASQGKSSDERSPDNSQPPPLPKKTLSRTNSAPGGSQCSTRSLPCSPGFQITNPLYGIYEGKSADFAKKSISTPCSPMNADEKFNLPGSLHSRRAGMIKSRSLDGAASYYYVSNSQVDIGKLNFSISDLDLRNWFNFENQLDIFKSLANRCVMSLKCICAKYNTFFMEDKKATITFCEKDWPDLTLPCDKASCNSRDAIYYRAQYTLEPRNEFALKITKALNQESLQVEPCGLSVQKGLPVHFNVQLLCGHFVATIPTKLLPPEETALISDDSETEKNNSGSDAAAETSETTPNGKANQRRQLVIVTQEVPYQTLADFVKESAALHESQADVYERQICLLLLQLCLGLEHLKDHNIIHCDLRLDNLLLVKVADQKAEARSKEQCKSLPLPRLIISNFSKAKQKSTAIDQKLYPDHARLAPEMISTSQYKKVDEFQLGILIYEVLHMSNPFESISGQKAYGEYNAGDLPQIRQLSIYSEGLQHLAHLLLCADPHKRIHIYQAKSILQALLWGPCSNAFSVNTGFKDPPHLLKNWLDVKRILLMLKFGERFLDESQAKLEDWLCCQYFESATPDSVFHAVEGLQVLLEEGC
ncbi:inactive tyrosine-protein kinase PEAK1 isoform X2 [Heterodontus francisci]|uniref:inactive tyrosine-protein kinase PEAK1 isoform X2 n=1 Tax=Heterodontus francisci TaxID=7792 RepID=UPI00355B19B6